MIDAVVAIAYERTGGIVNKTQYLRGEYVAVTLGRLQECDDVNSRRRCNLCSGNRQTASLIDKDDRYQDHCNDSLLQQLVHDRNDQHRRQRREKREVANLAEADKLHHDCPDQPAKPDHAHACIRAAKGHDEARDDQQHGTDTVVGQVPQIQTDRKQGSHISAVLRGHCGNQRQRPRQQRSVRQLLVDEQSEGDPADDRTCGRQPTECEQLTQRDAAVVPPEQGGKHRVHDQRNPEDRVGLFDQCHARADEHKVTCVPDIRPFEPAVAEKYLQHEKQAGQQVVAEIRRVGVKKDGENRGSKCEQSCRRVSGGAAQEQPAAEQVGAVQQGAEQVIGPDIQRIQCESLRGGLHGP